MWGFCRLRGQLSGCKNYSGLTKFWRCAGSGRATLFTFLPAFAARSRINVSGYRTVGGAHKLLALKILLTFDRLLSRKARKIPRSGPNLASSGACIGWRRVGVLCGRHSLWAGPFSHRGGRFRKRAGVARACDSRQCGGLFLSHKSTMGAWRVSRRGWAWSGGAVVRGRGWPVCHPGCNSV